jgi:hypothetical protein
MRWGGKVCYGIGPLEQGFSTRLIDGFGRKLCGNPLLGKASRLRLLRWSERLLARTQAYVGVDGVGVIPGLTHEKLLTIG